MPSRDVWGSFNGLMCLKYLVNLNELSKKESFDSQGRIKALITDESLTINEKGVNQYQIRSYHRFIITTNNEDPVYTGRGDRRNLIIRSSDEKCFEKEYFEQLHSDLDSQDTINLLADYFLYKVQDVEENFLSATIPVTPYQEELKSAARLPHDLWLEEFVSKQSCKEKTIRMYASQVFSDYKEWCEQNGFTTEGMNSTKLGVRLNNLFAAPSAATPDCQPKLILTEKSSRSVKVFNIALLQEYYNKLHNMSSMKEGKVQ